MDTDARPGPTGSSPLPYRTARPGTGDAGPVVFGGDAAPPAARELAASMRAGLEARRLLAPPPPEPSPAPAELPAAEYLLPLANLQGHAAASAPGPFAAGLHLARKVLRRMLQPWLGFQTGFNAAAVRVLDHHQHRLVAAGRRSDDLEARLADLGRYVQRLAGRLNECHLALDAERAARAGLEARLAVLEPDQGSDAPRPPVSAADDAGSPELGDDVLLGLFVHTRLPRPPARVLLLSDEPGAGGDLAALGYQVVAARPAAPLPFADAGFDAAVLHAAAGAEPALLDEAARVLRAGGRLVAALPPAQARAGRAWSPVETAYGVRRAGDWALASAAAGGVVALVVREKPAA